LHRTDTNPALAKTVRIEQTRPLESQSQKRKKIKKMRKKDSDVQGRAAAERFSVQLQLHWAPTGLGAPTGSDH